MERARFCNCSRKSSRHYCSEAYGMWLSCVFCFDQGCLVLLVGLSTVTLMVHQTQCSMIDQILNKNEVI